MECRKTVLITGASRGLGSSIACVFASKGYDVILTYLNSENDALSLKSNIESKYKVRVLCERCDVTSEENVKKLAKEVKEVFGKIDCLVNNAGISLDNKMVNKSLEEFRMVLDVNLAGTFNITKHISKIMDSGSIINITSTDGIDTFYEEEMDYASSKAGVNVLTKIMAKEFAPNIRVNAVAPGWINTDMNKDLFSEFKKQEMNKILLKRFAEPIEIANVVYFLASNESSYINGTVIRVDGGY